MSSLVSKVVSRGLPVLGLGILWGVGERLGGMLFDSTKKKKAADEVRERRAT